MGQKIWSILQDVWAFLKFPFKMLKEAWMFLRGKEKLGVAESWDEEELRKRYRLRRFEIVNGLFLMGLAVIGLTLDALLITLAVILPVFGEPVFTNCLWAVLGLSVISLIAMVAGLGMSASVDPGQVEARFNKTYASLQAS